MRTLLVEDDAGSRLLLGKVLRSLGHEVKAFESAEEAWQVCQEESFDLAVLDWMLPGMDGLELVQRIRSLPWGDLMLILVVTSCDRIEHLKMVLEAGADDYLAKPVHPELLSVRLRIAAHHHQNNLKRRAAERALQEANDKLEQRVIERTAELSETVAKLGRSKEKFRTLVESINEIVFSLDREGSILYVSPAMERATGYTESELVGKPFSRLVFPDDRDRLTESIREPGRTRELELRLVAKEGRVLYMFASFAGVTEDGKLQGVSGVLSDITDRRELEQRLRLAQRMEAIGQFAGGIAHDFNNLTMVLLTATDIIRNRLAKDDPLQAELSVVDNASSKAADLSRALLSFARREELEASPLDLNMMVAEMVPLLRRLIPDAISLRHIPAKESAYIRADRGRMGQVIMNLSANARDAMPAGGTIVIETGIKHLDEAFVQRHSGSGTGPYVCLSVRDTGIGMDAATLSRVFDPFFTTKEPGKGTGLGLASVYSAVKQHGGLIDISSAPGVGTNFLVYLPNIEPPQEQAQSEPVKPPRPGHETVLIVDDCDEYRDVLGGVLENHGYQVLGAKNGAIALEIINRGNPKVELVIADLLMPQMGGVELFRRSRAVCPSLAILLCSGQTLQEAGIDIEGQDWVGYLRKPFNSETLETRIRELLDRQSIDGSEA